MCPAGKREMYCVSYYDGSDGEEIMFDTFEEAKVEAEYKWDHLTAQERIGYTDRERGAWFVILEGPEDCCTNEIVDFADRMD